MGHFVHLFNEIEVSSIPRTDMKDLHHKRNHHSDKE